MVMQLDSDPADFSMHLFLESLIHIPGIFIQNLSERPIHIARNPQSGVSASELARSPMRDESYRLDYSWRRALIGSVRLTRRAGRELANRAARTRTEIMTTKV